MVHGSGSTFFIIRTGLLGPGLCCPTMNSTLKDSSTCSLDSSSECRGIQRLTSSLYFEFSTFFHERSGKTPAFPLHVNHLLKIKYLFFFLFLASSRRKHCSAASPSPWRTICVYHQSNPPPAVKTV